MDHTLQEKINIILSKDFKDHIETISSWSKDTYMASNRLLTLAGRIFKDSDNVGNTPFIMGLALLGQITGSIDLLYLAFNKLIARSSELQYAVRKHASDQFDYIETQFYMQMEECDSHKEDLIIGDARLSYALTADECQMEGITFDKTLIVKFLTVDDEIKLYRRSNIRNRALDTFNKLNPNVSNASDIVNTVLDNPTDIKHRNDAIKRHLNNTYGALGKGVTFVLLSELTVDSLLDAGVETLCQYKGEVKLAKEWLKQLTT